MGWAWVASGPRQWSRATTGACVASLSSYTNLAEFSGPGRIELCLDDHGSGSVLDSGGSVSTQTISLRSGVWRMLEWLRG